MKYIKLIIAVNEEYQESIIAELLDLEFDAFEQRNDTLVTFVPRERFSDVYREQIEQILHGFPGEVFIQSEEVVADKNWNRQWEKTIKAQHIGRFFVRPTWSRESPPENTVLLEIDPKMSFGTGYHETTRLMLDFLPDIICGGERVLDAGTGTGILAIAAVKLGAGEVLAFDIDSWSIRNVEENILLNEVAERICVKKGGIEILPAEKKYDVIMANIERNTIIDMVPVFSKKLARGGKVLVSGLLDTDRENVAGAAREAGMEAEETRQENEWLGILFKKSGR